MNPGFLSWILMIVAIILIASGWKRPLLRQMSDRGVFGFMIGMGVLGQLHVEAMDGTLVLCGAAVPLALVALTEGGRRRTWTRTLHYVSFSLFLASLYFLLHHLNELDPLLLPFRTIVGVTAPLAVITATLVRRPSAQIACVTLALLVGWALYGTMFHERGGLRFAGLTHQDEWWTTVAMTRVVSLAYEYSAAIAREASRIVVSRWKGLRR